MDRQFYQTYFEAEKKHWWFLVRRRIITDLLKKYLSGKQNAKILDYGCGSGFFVNELGKTGYEAFGTDSSAEAIAYGTSQSVKNIRVQNGDRLDFQDSSFDSVLALDVLEHLENEKPALDEIDRVLKRDGYFIATVPAYMFLWGVQDEVSRHFRRYTMKELVELPNRDRFELIKKTYFNTFLFLPIAAVRLVSRWLSLGNRDSDFSLNGHFINRILLLIFGTEARILRFINFPFGVSILAVFRKK